MDRFIHRAEKICKKQLISLALACAVLFSAAPLQAMALEEAPAGRGSGGNWGFESGDLSGWTVLTSGWGSNGQGSPAGVVSALSYGECELPTNQSGSYHLSGPDNGIPGSEGWEIRSPSFLLSGSGWISVKMGGKAAAVKVFLADGTQVGYYRQNRYHDVNYPYLSRGGSWNDMATYVMDLSEYLGREMYVVLCDEAGGGSCANALFDELITFYDAAPDPTFRYDTVTDGHAELGSASEVQIPWVMGYNLLRHCGENDVENGGFESGDLTGWTVLTEGFDASGAVVNERTYWDQELPYNQSGFYHLNGWNTGIPEAEGWAVRSGSFVLGGSGYISVKMGGNAAVTKVFLSDGTQIGYYRNFRFHDVNFPYIAEGGAWCDMATYVIDLSDYLGRELYIELHDEVINDGWANAFFDDVVTYYETAPDASARFDKVPDGHIPGESAKLTQIPWVIVPKISTEYANQIPNGDFETGDLSGWTLYASGFPIKNGLPAANSAETYWDQELPFNKSGNYFVNGWDLSGNEANTWRIRSTPFTLSGSGWISVKMGGHAAAVRVYKLDGTMVGEFDQSRFCDREFPHISKGGSWCEMATYYLDLTQNIGDVLYIELCDDSVNGGWANAFFDDVVTFCPTVPKATVETVSDGHNPGEKAVRVKIPSVVGMNNLYSPRNGGFEMGNLTGWTVEADFFKLNTAVLAIKDYNIDADTDGDDITDEFRKLPYNTSGNFILSGHDATQEESDTWVLRSSPFTLAGSGYISVKMGGRTAAFLVRTAEDNKIIAAYEQQRFNDVSFPYHSKGGSWRDMAVYVMDLSPYLGQKLVIELMDMADDAPGGWKDAYFDDVIGYYAERPTTKSDTVIGGYKEGIDEPEEFEIPWIYLDRHENELADLFPPTPPLKDVSSSVEADKTATVYPSNKPEYEINYKAVNLYEYFRTEQGLTAYQLDGSKLTFTRVTRYESNGAPVGIIADYSRLKMEEGSCYLVEYEYEQGGKTQTGQFQILVQPEELGSEVFNGGFETGNLAGWTVVEGNGFNTSTAVISDETWWGEEAPYNQAGKYHLDGWNTGIAESGTWTVRSSTFVLDGSGWISWRMGGKAAAVKVYTDGGTLVGYYKQTRFTDRDFPNVALGSWADMGTYVADLSGYIGQKLYIELCDEAVNGGWANAYFDEIVTCYETVPDWANSKDTVKNSNNGGDVEIWWRQAINLVGQSESEDAPSGTQVTNGGFETGDLTGWTPIGFDANAVISAQTYWGEKLPYNQAGDFHLDGWTTGIAEGDTWAVRSGTFKLDGSGYISVRMGGHAAAVKVYTASDDKLVGYYKQTRFSDTSFPNVKGGSWADMGTYVMDLSDYIGKELYIELCDEPAAGWAHAFFDEVVTYYETAPDWKNTSDRVVNGKGGNGAVPEIAAIPWQLAANRAAAAEPDPNSRDIINGGFEYGDLTGWTQVTGNFGDHNPVISAETYFVEKIPYNQAGNYHMDGHVDNTGIAEPESWAIRSSTFTLDGSGFISVRMGGHAAAVKVYTADDNALVGYYKQTRYSDTGFPSVEKGSWLDMGTYVIDLSDYKGEKLYIELWDEGDAAGWAFAFFDEVVTCYESAPDWENGSDTVADGGTGDPVQIPWQLAWNELDGPRPVAMMLQTDGAAEVPEDGSNDETAPEETISPEEPGDSEEPADSEEPEDPAEPENPDEPENPEGPDEPEEKTGSEETTAPVDTDNPEAPEEPVDLSEDNAADGNQE